MEDQIWILCSANWGSWEKRGETRRVGGKGWGRENPSQTHLRVGKIGLLQPVNASIRTRGGVTSYQDRVIELRLIGCF